MALDYAGMTVIDATIVAPVSRVLIMLATTIIFAALGLLFWATWEVDEQSLTVVIVLVSLGALLLSGMTTRNQPKKDLSPAVPS